MSEDRIAQLEARIAALEDEVSDVRTTAPADGVELYNLRRAVDEAKETLPKHIVAVVKGAQRCGTL